MLAALVLAAGLAMATSGPIPADTGVICNPHAQTCVVTVETPPTPGGSPGGASSGETRVCIASSGAIVTPGAMPTSRHRVTSTSTGIITIRNNVSQVGRVNFMLACFSLYSAASGVANPCRLA